MKWSVRGEEASAAAALGQSPLSGPLLRDGVHLPRLRLVDTLLYVFRRFPLSLRHAYTLDSQSNTRALAHGPRLLWVRRYRQERLWLLLLHMLLLLRIAIRYRVHLPADKDLVDRAASLMVRLVRQGVTPHRQRAERRCPADWRWEARERRRPFLLNRPSMGQLDLCSRRTTRVTSRTGWRRGLDIHVVGGRARVHRLVTPRAVRTSPIAGADCGP